MIIPYNSIIDLSFIIHIHTSEYNFDKNTALYRNTMVSLYGLLLGGETAYFETWLNSLAIIYSRASSLIHSRDTELHSTSYFV